MYHNWHVLYGDQKIQVKFIHIEDALNTARSLILKELEFNDKIKDNPKYSKQYNIDIEVLRLIEGKFKDAFDAQQEAQKKLIPGGQIGGSKRG